jgi:hypothetical protein
MAAACELREATAFLSNGLNARIGDLPPQKLPIVRRIGRQAVVKVW